MCLFGVAGLWEPHCGCWMMTLFTQYIEPPVCLFPSNLLFLPSLRWLPGRAPLLSNGCNITVSRATLFVPKRGNLPSHKVLNSFGFSYSYMVWTVFIIYYLYSKCICYIHSRYDILLWHYRVTKCLKTMFEYVCSEGPCRCWEPVYCKVCRQWYMMMVLRVGMQEIPPWLCVETAGLTRAHWLLNMSNRCAARPNLRVQSVWLGPDEAAQTSHHPHTLHNVFIISSVTCDYYLPLFEVVYRTLNIQPKREIPVWFTDLCALYISIKTQPPKTTATKGSKGICSYTHWLDIYEALYAAWVSEPRHTRYRQCTENRAGGRVKDSQPPIKERQSTSDLHWITWRADTFPSF